eukprot:TRINITY_DN14483_c0_g1_i3.p1 TRINITY_DN14483_c0_g1~~TRINITY_DN14483_c0_g1_i3.p1  ORF type:complete len:538 (+),score=150.74 TRINITY_DN14483_c0_g1_i3:77-1690(+)
MCIRDRFNMVSNKRAYKDLRMFITFLDRLYMSVSNSRFLDAISKGVFNLVFLQIFQPRILSFATNLPAARTTIQYIILMLENIKSHQLATLIFHFLFGFCGVLRYRYAQPVVQNAQELKMGDGSFEFSRIDSDNKSLHDFYSEESSKIFDAVVSIENFLEAQNESGVVFAEELFSEDRKVPITSRSPNNRRSSDLIELPEVIDVREYSLERHCPIEISSFVVNLIRHEHGGYSNIGLQLFSQLLEFNIKEFYDVLVFGGVKSAGYDSIKSIEEMKEYFEHYKSLTANMKRLNLDEMYYKFTISLSDASLYPNIVDSPAERLRKKESFKVIENNYPANRSTMVSLIPRRRKSWSTPSRDSLLKSRAEFRFNRQAAKTPRISSAADINLFLKVNGSENVFVKVICNKLKRMPYNSFDDNLFLAAIILKLFSVPANPLDAATVSFHSFLTDKNSFMGILRDVADEIVQTADKLPRLQEIIKRRNEIHKKVAANILTTISIEDAKTDRFVDVLPSYQIGCDSVCRDVGEYLCCNASKGTNE